MEFDKITAILTPILVILFKDQPIIVISLPLMILFVELFKNILNYYSTKHNWSNLSCIEILSKDNNDSPNKIYYTTLWFLLENKIDINKMSCYNSKIIKHNNKNYLFNKIRPNYEANNSNELKFVYDKITYYIKLAEIINGEKQSKIIKIYSNKLNDIEKLINKSVDEHIKYLINQTKNVYCHYTYNIKDEIWNYKKIKTIKTKSNVFLDNDMINNIYKNIDIFMESNDIYKKHGIPYKKGFMFYGIPGTGKTSLIYAISRDYNRNIYSLKLNEFYSHSLFVKAINRIPSGNMIIIEDIDNMNISNKRELKSNNIEVYIDKNKDDDEEENSSTSYKSSSLSLDSLLEVLDGYNYLHDTIIIFTTNHINVIDTALLRPGRIDEIYKFDYSTYETCCEIIKNYFDDYNEEDIEILKDNKITTASLINRIIMPNYGNYKRFINELHKYYE